RLRLNGRAFEHAKELVRRGRVVVDDGGVWGLHRSSARKESAFIRRRGLEEYGKWFLGVDDEAVAVLARIRDLVEAARGLPGDPEDAQSRYVEADAGDVGVGCLYLPKPYTRDLWSN